MVPRWTLYLQRRGLAKMNNDNKNLCPVCQYFKSYDLSQWQTYQLNNFAKWFIKENKIESGYGLSKYLDLSVGIDNHASVGEWLKLLIREKSYTIKELKTELQKKVPLRFFRKAIKNSK